MSYNTDSSCSYKKLAVDMFAFSYLMGGINFTDISLLTDDNIDNDRLIYVRQKTKKRIILPLSEQAKKIIDKYCDTKRKFLFPILDNRNRTATQKKDRIYERALKK